LISISFSLLNSQNSCGTIITEQEMQDFYNRDKSYLYNNSLKNTTIVEIPVVYHLTREDNGTGGFSLSKALRLHCELNERFLDAEIQFYILDIRYHNNSVYHHMSNNSTGSDMMNNENNLNACNIFVVEEAKSGDFPVCGYSYRPESYPGPNRGGIVLDIGCSSEGSTTLTHEMGHYLNLPHTFYRWEGHDYDTDPIPTFQWERADGSNCTSTGDGFCDTKPDYISDRWFCNNPISFQDAVGQTFNVDEKNYMSYANDGCHQYFKQDQMTEMKAAAANFRPYLLTTTVPDLTPLSAPIFYFPISNMTNASYDTLDFYWNSVVGADYYLFELSNNNFNTVFYSTTIDSTSFTYYNLSPNQNYSWRVKGYNYGAVCNDFTVSSFKTSPTASTDAVIKNNVLCNSNSDGSATVITSGAIDSYNWYKFNETTYSYDFFNITATNNINNLGAAHYYVNIVRSNGNMSNVYFVINEPNELIGHIGANGNYLVSFLDGGNPPYTYNWSNGENGYINFNPTPGENTLIVSDNNGCFKMLSFNFTPNTINAIYNDLYEISVYPNPAKGDFLYIDFKTKNNSSVKFEIFSSLGTLVYTNSTLSQKENLIKIDVSLFLRVHTLSLEL